MDAWEFEDAPLFVHLAYQCCCCYSSFLFVCFVGLYAGHPYIQLISFEIFLLSCNNIAHDVQDMNTSCYVKKQDSPSKSMIIITRVSNHVYRNSVATFIVYYLLVPNFAHFLWVILACFVLF